MKKSERYACCCCSSNDEATVICTEQSLSVSLGAHSVILRSFLTIIRLTKDGKEGEHESKSGTKGRAEATSATTIATADGPCSCFAGFH